MFANFFYLLSALLIFSTYTPEKEYSLSLFDPAFLLLSLYAFHRLTQMRFKSLNVALDDVNISLKEQEQFQQISTFLMISSVVFLFGATYFLHLKEIIISVTGLPKAFFLQELLGLAYFFIFFWVFWRGSFKYYAAIFQSALTRDEYVKSQLKFNVPILAPWFLISLLFVTSEYFLTHFGISISQNLKDFIVLPVFFIVTAIFLPVIIKMMWGCKALKDSEQQRELDEFCHNQGLKYQSLLEWNVFEGKIFTAGIMGLIPQLRYILITPVMLQYLTMEELKAVLAHEIGHNKNHHMSFYLLFFLGFILISINYPDLMFLAVAYMTTVDTGNYLTFFATNSPYFSLIWITIPIVILLVIYFRLFYGLFSRAFEREADAHSVLTMGNGDGIISSLEKIGVYSGNIRDMPNWHHYSIRERVDFIQECCDEPATITRHKKKVRNLKIGYVVFFVCLIGLTFYMKSINTKQNLQFAIIERALLQEATDGRGSLELHLGLGNIYLEQNQLFKAEEQLLLAREYDRYNVEVLNNLAWLYVTTDEPVLQKYESALNLGLMALALKRAPFILDTVAECYYKLGDFEQAIALEEEALMKAENNREFFEEQLRKFRKSLSEINKF